MDTKRAFDIAAGGTLLIVSAIPIAVLAAFTAVSTRSNPFFVQERVGLDRKPFDLFKLKSMTDQRDTEGKLLPDARRVTRLGVFLRKTHLDELPQLFNVVAGDMSLVGPRPTIAAIKFTAEDVKRHTVRPGLTGLAQTQGKNSLTLEERLALDHEYVDTHTFFGDLKILAQTPISVLTHLHTPHYDHHAQEGVRQMDERRPEVP